MRPGECVSVCAACGRRVIVPPSAGVPPILRHEADCPRDGWPIRDAVLYSDDSSATVANWVRV